MVMDPDIWLTFQVFIVVALAATFILMGALIAYFGSKKTRIVGAGFSVLGLLLALVWYSQTYMGDMPWREVDMFNNILAVIGAGLGAVAGVGLFLVAIIKS